MKEQIQEAILALTSTAVDRGNAIDALQFSQAALNLAHVIGVLETVNEGLTINPVVK